MRTTALPISPSSFQHFSVQNFRFYPMFLLNENPVPIRDRMPGLEKNLAAVIDKALIRNPKDRFTDAGKLLAAIR